MKYIEDIEDICDGVDFTDPARALKACERLIDLLWPSFEPDQCDWDALLELADKLSESADALRQRLYDLPFDQRHGYEIPLARQEDRIAYKIRVSCGVYDD